VLTREELHRWEVSNLAGFAQKSAESRGRIYSEPTHPFRTEFQRDRDRVIHSRAFRRLEYKTQVFLNGTGDHYRTRLTHTMEVAAISRTIARCLRLNEDLAEAIALAHDLGHPPFGHAGEKTLDELMAVHGGFEHNRQALRVVEELEQKYPGFDGLNLTWEVREGLAKHFAPHREQGFHSPSLEAQIANLADEITYYSHDLDDGLEAGLIEERKLEQIALWGETFARVKAEHPQLDDERRHYFLIRCLINTEVEDVITTSSERLAASSVTSADDARRRERRLIAYSDELRRKNLVLREFLYKNLYYHPAVHEPNERACDRIRSLFRAYLDNPDRLGSQARRRIEKVGLHRAVCDYMAGMTDRYAVDEWERILGNK
jgi:dGTPase